MELRKAIIIAVVAVTVLGTAGLLVGLRSPGRSDEAVAASVPGTMVPVGYDPGELRAERFEGERRERHEHVKAEIPKAERQRVPVLMYHEITPGPNNLYVAPDELTAHLQWLKENGYTAITLRRLYNHLVDGAPIPEKPVVLTFDDSYASHYDNAMPLLKQYGWPGTIFVITGSIGERGHMTWDQVRAAAREGMELGAHTINHPSLELLSGERLVREIAGSRKALQEETGQSIDFFCYPAGKLNDEVVRVTREAGFLGAVTTKPGLADADQDPFYWQRIRINKGLSPRGLAGLIESHR